VNVLGDTILGRAVAQTALAVKTVGHRSSDRKRELTCMADVIFYGIAFVFLGLCLLYVRAVDRL
jgi:hypothetical protein